MKWRGRESNFSLFICCETSTPLRRTRKQVPPYPTWVTPCRQLKAIKNWLNFLMLSVV